MRIVIDVQALQNGSKNRGIGRYTSSLVKAILRNNHDVEIVLLLNGLFLDNIQKIKQEFEDLVPINNILIFDFLGDVDYLNPQNLLNRKVSEILYEKIIADLQPNIFLITSLFEGSMDNTITSIKEYFPNLFVGVILYDLIPLISKEKYLGYEPLYNWYFEKIKFLNRADLLFSISESSKSEAVNYLQIESNKIINISSAVDQSIFHEVPYDAELLTKLGISKPFIMHTSAFEERKNFEGLIAAFALLDVELRKQFQLVLVCKLTQNQKDQLFLLGDKCGLSADDLILTGFVDDDSLVKLYSSCKLFVFPSLHEGFGLPILEAMSCGAVAIGSKTTSIPEVIGLEEALFDPMSAKDIAEKMETILQNESLWQELKEHAKVQSTKFSWGKSAQKILDTLNKIPLKNENPIPDNMENAISSLAKLCMQNKYTEMHLLRISKILDQNLKKIEKYEIFKNSIFNHLTVRIEGPFDSSYSLALLNRETARGLEELGHTVALHSTEGPGDFEPNRDFLVNNEDLNVMHERVKNYLNKDVDVISRNLYPPRVNDMDGKLNMLHHYAWEEAGFPREWAENFNTYLDGMTCLSTHIEKIMIDNGVKIPMTTSGCGVDHWEKIEADNRFSLKAKTFKFLHVSSCFPRKGVDTLLEAYGQAFTNEDDVSLIIKTFSNPHNNVRELLKNSQTKNTKYPHVVIIEEDMSDEKLKALYERCDVLVAPSKAEGFGLPMAEAMLSGLPVITTRWGGQLDFCNDENSWLVDYEFEYAKTHFNLFGSVWAKVDIDDLAIKLKDAHKSTKDIRKKMALVGRGLLLADFKWVDVSQRFIEHVNLLNTRPDFSSELRIGWISSWKTKCGIATYSEHLISNFSSSDIVILSPLTNEIINNDESIRCWHSSKELNDFSSMSKIIQEKQINTLIVQFNYGFYNFSEFNAFLETQLNNGIIVIVMMHSTHDPFGEMLNWQLLELRETLSGCNRILVHSVSDLNRLKLLGLVDNVAIFPHGVLDFEVPEKKLQTSKIPTVASYGFCLPHKGLPELVEAAYILKKQGNPIRLKLVNAEYPVPESTDLIRFMKQQIEKYELQELVEINNDFLEDSESLALLSEADLLVFAYQNTGESASGAVRYGLAAKRPVIVTPLKIFEDLGESVFKFKGVSPKDIASGILDTVNSIGKNTNEAQHILNQADKWRSSNDYRVVGKRLENICRSLLVNNKRFDSIAKKQ